MIISRKELLHKQAEKKEKMKEYECQKIMRCNYKCKCSNARNQQPILMNAGKNIVNSNGQQFMMVPISVIQPAPI